MTANKACMEALSNDKILVWLYLMVFRPPSKECEDSGEEDYVERVQEKAIAILTTMCAEKVNGVRLVTFLQRFLPPGLVDQLREGPKEATRKAFHMKSETPEHVWNPSMAKKLSQEVI